MFSLNHLKHRVLDWARYQKNLHTNERVKLNIDRFKKSSNKKDKITIRREIADLKKYWGDIPLQYITHDFYVKDCEISLEEMKNYIPSYYFYYVICPKYDDIKKVSYLVEDKFKSYFLFKDLGYKVAKSFFVKKEGVFDPAISKFLTRDDLTLWLNKSCADKLFIKPINGRGGKGIIVAHKKNDNYFIGNKVVNFEFIRSLKGNYIVESGIQQSLYVSSVYPNSVNTLRVITKRDLKTNIVDIIAVVLRVGTCGRELDNACQGGLLLGIDIATGVPVTGNAVFEYGSEYFKEHPDTNYKFSNFAIHEWSDFKDKILIIANRMHHINLAGWDIAITDDGPQVIEVNVLFGLDLLQSSLGGLKKYFISDSPIKSFN